MLDTLSIQVIPYFGSTVKYPRGKFWDQVSYYFGWPPARLMRMLLVFAKADSTACTQTQILLVCSNALACLLRDTSVIACYALVDEVD